MPENPDMAYKFRKFSGVLGLCAGDRLALVGCGGKTSLMYRIAEENRYTSVLIGTTTHILRPAHTQYDYEITSGVDIDEAAALPPKSGITLAYGGEEGGKLLPLSSDDLARLNPAFDYTILESDGSKRLPLKGWLEHEPVVADFTTLTIGVCTVQPVGQTITDSNTLRLRRFCEIAGAKLNDIVTESHVAAMLSHPYGMMRKALGRKIVFINQVESESDAIHTRKLLSLLPEDFLHSLSRVIAGSLKYNKFEVLWRHPDDEK